MERATLTKLYFKHSRQEYVDDGTVSIPTEELERAIIHASGDCYVIWWVGAREEAIVVREDPLKLLENEED